MQKMRKIENQTCDKIAKIFIPNLLKQMIKWESKGNSSFQEIDTEVENIWNQKRTKTRESLLDTVSRCID